jgi:hypothetical protein
MRALLLTVAVMGVLAPGRAAAQEVRWLYPSLLAAQASDVHSTRLALTRQTGREINPLLVDCAHSTPCLIGVKAVGTGAILLIVERVRKKHKRAAFWATAAIVAVTAGAAWHNYRVARPR